MTGKELRSIRDRLQLTQEKLARNLGVTPNTVARWERGEMTIGPTVAAAVQYLAAQAAAKPATDLPRFKLDRTTQLKLTVPVFIQDNEQALTAREMELMERVWQLEDEVRRLRRQLKNN
ncbi:MAG TPA: helix-turn-helix domain-containing protein [Planctomycetota bacterium]|nr:helix-turn-helix domain-containing protein [Planctomycetota bacterium]